MDMLLPGLLLPPSNPGLRASLRLRVSLILLLRCHLRHNHNGATGQTGLFLCLDRDGLLLLNRSSRRTHQGCSTGVAFILQQEARGISSTNRYYNTRGGTCEGSGLACLPKTVGSG